MKLSWLPLSSLPAPQNGEPFHHRAGATLLGAGMTLAPQVWYNQKATAASAFWSQRGMRVHKEDIVGQNPKKEFAMTFDEYMSVSKMTMRFYIAAKLLLHYLELSIAFSGCPLLG